MPTAVVILAAGQGTRMQSDTPKVLHTLAGAPLVAHAMASARTLDAERTIVVTGHGGEAVTAAVHEIDPDAQTVTQEEQLGTGHALLQCLDALDGFDGDVLVLYGDTPLIRQETLEAMLEARATGTGVIVLGFHAANPTGYGRLIRDPNGALLEIVEEKEASDLQKAETFCNSGVIAADANLLRTLLPRISNDNAKGEYYLTDIVGLARADGHSATAVECDEAETLGVNSRIDLAAAERAFQFRARIEAMENGATLTDPDTVFFAQDTIIGRDVTIGPNVVFGPDVTIESGVNIHPFCHLEGCHVSRGAVIGPFARLRPGAELSENTRVGNFVEIKNATIAENTKVNHLSYIGDATLGSGTNIGAGTITCNYDGVFKHRTSIGDNVFVGSNSALVAPVTVGNAALIAAGSTITDDVPAGALALARSRQSTKGGIGKRLMDRLKSLKHGTRH
ncbi:bifunctional UDP-N-acetylglucosamine diphosphorylase/glucosamine-1-phosphate N-acetyltransferase GlmU [Amaricoccus tamworthensis]|uniref:bifunctional UDP-N-acetylglucosamine diphosphorylase/glucosamine-1-phosphate N-acetyltransferase GlmU n=1 Tax=Amaricoccus tamworthensis TaxID=57002 RepID=UPI003C7B4539